MLRNALLSALLLGVYLTGVTSALGQDEITVASESPCLAVAGNPIAVPVYVRDVSGTPLGLDQPPGKRIEGLSFQIAYSPAAYVSSILIRRAGLLAPRVPVSEFALASGNTISYLGLFEEQYNTLRFHLDAASPGDLVAEIVLTLSPAATAGSRMEFTFGGPSTNALTDEHGVVSETANDSTLRTHNGCIQLVGRRRRAARESY